MCLGRLILFIAVVGIASRFLGTGGTSAVALIMLALTIQGIHSTNKYNEKLFKYWKEKEQDGQQD